MVDTNYKIGALDILLNSNCLCERYYPLIMYKDLLIADLPLLGCATKNDVSALTDEKLIEVGLKDIETAALFRRFLTLYDPKPAKFREIDKLCSCEDERTAFRELYHLPGVKYTRANLYYRSGYKSLDDIARTSEEEILRKTALTIKECGLAHIVPLPKEVRTHIAVAKAFMFEKETQR